MILRYTHLSRYDTVFQTMTGLKKHLFDEVVRAVEPRFIEAESQRFRRPDRQRAVGGGRTQGLSLTD